MYTVYGLQVRASGTLTRAHGVCNLGRTARAIGRNGGEEAARVQTHGGRLHVKLKRAVRGHIDQCRVDVVRCHQLLLVGTVDIQPRKTNTKNTRKKQLGQPQYTIEIEN